MDSTLLQQTPLQPDPGIGSGQARTPLALKIFGALLVVGGALLIPEVVLVWLAVGQEFVKGSFSDESMLTVILSLILTAAVCFAIVSSVVLGIRLLRGKRRRARLLAESMAIALVVALACDHGFHVDL